jgi:hypothetical protein
MNDHCSLESFQVYEYIGGCENDSTLWKFQNEMNVNDIHFVPASIFKYSKSKNSTTILTSLSSPSPSSSSSASASASPSLIAQRDFEDFEEDILENNDEGKFINNFDENNINNNYYYFMQNDNSSFESKKGA